MTEIEASGRARNERVIWFGGVIGNPVDIPGDPIRQPLECVEVWRGLRIEWQIELGILSVLSIPPVIELHF